MIQCSVLSVFSHLGGFPNHPDTNHEIHLCFKSLGSTSVSHCKDSSGQLVYEQDLESNQSHLGKPEIFLLGAIVSHSSPAQSCATTLTLAGTLTHLDPGVRPNLLSSPPVCAAGAWRDCSRSAGRLCAALGFLPSAHGRIIWLRHMWASLMSRQSLWMSCETLLE